MEGGLDNSEGIQEESIYMNERVVLTLYEALSARDRDMVHKLLAPDLEWWFHGPPSHQFMMRLLTGSSSAFISSPLNTSFEFVPQSIAAVGSTVLVEGCDHTRSISWVHAWTVKEGTISQVREYFNTSLTVTRLGNTAPSLTFSSEMSSESSSSSSSPDNNPLHGLSVWKSSVSDRVGKSVPGLVLFV